LAFRYELPGLLELCGRNMISSLTADNVASACAALRGVRTSGDMARIWEEVKRKVKGDPFLLEQVMLKVRAPVRRY